MDSKWINVLAAGGKRHFKTTSVHKLNSKKKFPVWETAIKYCRYADSNDFFLLFYDCLFSKFEGIPQNHHYSPDVCHILVYIWVLEIWPLVQALSWEAPLRVKGYFQCAYLYSGCLNREQDLPSNQARKLRDSIDQNLIYTVRRECIPAVQQFTKSIQSMKHLTIFYESVQWREYHFYIKAQAKHLVTTGIIVNDSQHQHCDYSSGHIFYLVNINFKDCSL